MNNNRSWMYERNDDRGFLNSLFISGVEEFMNHAISQPTSMGGTSIQCPCSKCKNRKFWNGDTVKLHLLKNGFVKDYYVWSRHGESYIYDGNDEHPSANYSNISRGTDGNNLMYNMVIDAAGPSFDPHGTEEIPNAAAQNIYTMLKSSERELYDGCETSQLAAMAQMLSLKSDHHWSEACYDQTSQFVKGILPKDNTFLDSFYNTKKHMEGLGLPSIHIDCCVNGCMIYWNEDIDMESCKFCSHPRYKIRVNRSTRERKKVAAQRMIYFPLAPRLQRLYASPTTAAHMRWHADHYKEDGVMHHCSDSEEWKQFDRAHPLFSSEIRNVRLGLSADGFQPFGSSGKQYSSWPIIVTPYNLPPWMCSKEEYMFLSILVPGPRNPKQKIDVFLQPLISELKMLWEVGVETWDTSLKQNFQMRAALMWTVSDFPAYSMLSGWKTAGHLACPHCAHDHDAYNLKHGGKPTWFDNHRKFLPVNHPFRKNKHWFTKGKAVSEFPPPIRTGEDVLQEIESLGLMKITELGSEEHNARIIKTYNCGWKKRSIFWDLPYWRTLSIRHNLDVMHVEKNVFENLFNTIMAIEGKTKDNAKARADIALLCRRPELAINESTRKYPKACYSLDKKGKEAVCKWLQDLKFPDGYVSNMGRCIDMKKYKLFGMKSHDCHVFMQRLLPIAFREFLPNNVWEVVTELSLFFKDLTSATLKVSDMRRLEEQIPVILCKLERIFPPALFDSMEHLLVHLPYEARIAGPVQYRWMYPFERFLRHLKNNIKNKARVEGSICNAYLVEEASKFCSHYFEQHVQTKQRNVPRNDSSGGGESFEGNFSIFSHPGRASGCANVRYLDDREYKAAHNYVLLNCPEIAPYTEIFINMVREHNRSMTDAEIDRCLESDFAIWFKQYAQNPSLVPDEIIRDIASGPLRSVRSVPIFYVNGYKFHTRKYGENKSTFNSGFLLILSKMSARRLRLSVSPNPGNSTEHTPIRSPRSEAEHTPGQSRVLSSASANEPANESADPYWEVGSMHDDGRMRIEVICGLLEPSGRCARVITDSISERQDPDGFNWKAVSKEVKAFYFDEFKKSCVWRQDDKVIYKAWAKKAATRYSNFCCDARGKWEKGEQDNRVAMHVWLRWVEFWKTPDFQVKSTTQKKNRKGGADKYPPTHTGGSASLRTHAAVLAKTQGKDPTPADVYLVTHTVKHDKKTFVTKKAEQVYKRVEKLREERSAPIEGSDEPQVVDEDQLFLEAAGGLDKKNRVYGLGSLQSVIYGSDSGSSQYRPSNFNNEEYKQMQVELQDMKNQVKELQELRNQELEEMKKQMEEMKSQLAMVFSIRNGN